MPVVDTTAGDTHPQSMRAWLAELEARGELLHVRDRIALEFEVAGALAAADGREAVLFHDVVGSALPLVGNVAPNRLAFVRSAGAEGDRDLQARIVASVERPLPPHEIAANAQKVVERPVLLDELPVPRFFEGEAGRYITAGAIVAVDRGRGCANLSIARIMPLDGNRALVGIAPNHHLSFLLRAAHARGEQLDIAVALGNHPLLMLAACLYLGLGADEMHVAGALFGSGLEVVRTANDLLVPAHAEVILEGSLDAGERAPEGRVSEFHGLYECYGPGVVATFGRLTRRRDALVQTILPGYHQEHCLLGGIAIAAGLARSVRARVASLDAIAVGFGGAGRLHAVVALHAPQPGDARKAMFAVWADVNLIKRVIVVDDDIDPWDAEEVEWALATRVIAERDTLIVPGVRADRSEPLESGGTVTKTGIDATRRGGDRPDWTPARPPHAASARGREIIAAARALRTQEP